MKIFNPTVAAVSAAQFFVDKSKIGSLLVDRATFFNL